MAYFHKNGIMEAWVPELEALVSSLNRDISSKDLKLKESYSEHKLRLRLKWNTCESNWRK